MDDTGADSRHGLLPVRPSRPRIAAFRSKDTQARVRFRRDRRRISGRGGRQQAVGGKRKKKIEKKRSLMHRIDRSWSKKSICDTVFFFIIIIINTYSSFTK